MSEGEFGGLNFPIIKDIVPRLSDDLISVQPMTTVEAAKGRPIKPYPVKYDDFRTADDLEEYVKMRGHPSEETHLAVCALRESTMTLDVSTIAGAGCTLTAVSTMRSCFEKRTNS